MPTTPERAPEIVTGDGCRRGCTVALLAPIIGTFVASLSVYATQALFNPRPLHHENCPILYLLTLFEVASITGLAALGLAFLYWLPYYYWQYWPKKRWFLLVFAALVIGVSWLAYNPGDPSDPDDPSFSLD